MEEGRDEQWRDKRGGVWSGGGGEKVKRRRGSVIGGGEGAVEVIG